MGDFSATNSFRVGFIGFAIVGFTNSLAFRSVNIAWSISFTVSICKENKGKDQNYYGGVFHITSNELLRFYYSL